MDNKALDDVEAGLRDFLASRPSLAGAQVCAAALTAITQLRSERDELWKELIPPTPNSVVIERARDRIEKLEQQIAAKDKECKIWEQDARTFKSSWDQACNDLDDKDTQITQLKAALSESCDERRTHLLHEIGLPCPAEREAEANMQDAERYRWLRQMDAGGIQVYNMNDHADLSIFGEDLDSAIDAAIGQEGK